MWLYYYFKDPTLFFLKFCFFFLMFGLPNLLHSKLHLHDRWIAVISNWGWRRQWHPTPVFLPGKSHGQRSLVGCRLQGCIVSDTTEQLHFDFSLFTFPALEKEMATHSSVLAWRIPGTGEPGGLPSLGSHRVGHDWSALAAAAAAIGDTHSQQVSLYV